MAAGALVAVLAVLVALAGCGAGAPRSRRPRAARRPRALPPGPRCRLHHRARAHHHRPAPSPSTTIVVAPDGDPGASPVEGLDALALREAVTSPPSDRARRASGPVAETVTLSDGTVVWRLRIPGSFPARDARAVVAVDGATSGRRPRPLPATRWSPSPPRPRAWWPGPR